MSTLSETVTRPSGRLGASEHMDLLDPSDPEVSLPLDNLSLDKLGKWASDVPSPFSGLGGLHGLRERPEMAPPSAAVSPLNPVRSTPRPPASTGLGGLPAHFAAIIPSLMAVKARILEELEANPLRLKALNQSRREALALHLDRMAGLPPAPSSLNGGMDPVGGLRRWIEGARSPAQNASLQAYFEEVALLVLGQAILLKAWSDRGVRAWNKADLGRLNWALSSTLRPQVPLDREGWQLTRQNIYSWYNPSPVIQEEIWNALASWRITDEGPSFITFLMGPARQTKLPEGCSYAEGYDPRFFKSIWENISQFGFTLGPESGPMRRQRILFSPTLRNGSMVRTGPVSVGWIGLEASGFSLMAAELVQLWWGPAPPPLWASGNGLEVHVRDQLTFALGSPKPSLLSRISDMEACDAAFVLEERSVRPQGRSLEAQRLREQLEGLPYFKKIKNGATPLGCLQACVALSKLRPGGLLWWAREEPLTSADGAEMLHFLLERGKILCEWDFSELSHSLPVQIPLFPKHLYLIQRETLVEERLGHRPIRVSMQGQIRSHVEIPLVLQDALGAIHRPGPAHGQWQVHAQKSPTLQKDWMERWPDPACQNQLRLMESIRKASLPLASATMVKLTPEGDPAREGQWSVHGSMRGLWLRAGLSNAEGGEKRTLEAMPLPRVGSETKGHGFMVLVPDEAWVAPLLAYLRSEEVRGWLDLHAERKGDRWILNEQTVRFIPVPRSLLQALGVPAAMQGTQGTEPGSFESGEGAVTGQHGAHFALPLPGDWERIASELGHSSSSLSSSHSQGAMGVSPSNTAGGPSSGAREAREALGRLDRDLETGAVDQATASRIRATIFVRASRALEQMSAGHGRLLSVVTPEGRIRWRELLDILPKSECVGITLSPRVRVVGQIPPHIPIGRFDRIGMPQMGVLLSTELGLNTQIFCDSPVLLDMIWEQLDGLSHPTWSELVQYLRVPRRLEIAEATAIDVLKSHGEHSHRYQELLRLIAACRLY